METIRRQLEKLVVGKTISSIEILNKGSFRAEKDSLIGKSITDVGRKGKVLVITLGEMNKIQNLFVHLKMSGQLQFINRNISNSSKKARPFLERSGLSMSKHLRVAIGFTGGSHLLFHDQRKFGWITDNPAVFPMGIDALDPELTAGKLAEILQSSNRPVKTILLDQSKIAGIGNIYASEILWEAGISPWARFKEEGRRKKVKGKKNEPVKFRKLHHAVRKVLTEAIKYGGSTMDDGLYLHVGGESGSYWSRRRVYDREGEPCLRCKSPVKKGVIGQRSTFWCPACQRLSA